MKEKKNPFNISFDSRSTRSSQETTERKNVGQKGGENEPRKR